MRSSTSFVLKMAFRVLMTLFAISLMRKALNVRPLTFSYFLQLLSDVQFDFSTTLAHFAVIAADFDLGANAAWYEVVVSWLRGIFDAITLPISLVKDIFLFILSVLRFVVLLIGIDPWGVSPWLPAN